MPVLKIQRRNEGLWGLQKRLTLALGAQGRRLGMTETSAFLPVFLELSVSPEYSYSVDQMEVQGPQILKVQLLFTNL